MVPGWRVRRVVAPARLTLWLTLFSVAPWCVGCVTSGVPGPIGGTSLAAPTGAPAGSSGTVPASAAGSQALYRLTHDGGDGRTSLKVVLRRGAGERFQVVLSDIAGRRVLSLDHSVGQVVLIDHREGSYCVTGPNLTLPEVHPEELPLAAVPRVLAGEFPIDGVVGNDDAELVDETGRRWRRLEDATGLVSWTLLDEEGPALWWSRDDDGGVLSRRDGEQYRWRLIVREATSGPLESLVPQGYVEGVCDA